MQTVILAGGFGTRLQPVLKDLPKPLAPVNSKCFLEYLLDSLKSNSLTDFIFCLHYMAEKLIDFFDDGSKYGVKTSYSIEEQPLGTAGAIGRLRNSLSDTFCVVNADTYLELDMKDCVAAHRKSGAIATIAVTAIMNTSRYGLVTINNNGLIKGFTEKGKTNLKQGYISAGLYVFEPEIFDYIPENRFVSLENEIFPALLADKRIINSYTHIANFFDIGIPEDYCNFLQWTGALPDRIIKDGEGE